MRSIPVAVAMVGLLLSACGVDPATKVLMLQRRCIEEDIKPRLKDPESIRILERDHEDLGPGGNVTDLAVLEYTATNSFNARIRNRRLCAFNGDSLEVAYNVNSNNDALEFEETDFVFHNPNTKLKD